MNFAVNPKLATLQSVNLEVYKTPTGTWVASPDASFEDELASEQNAKKVVRVRGAVRTRGAADARRIRSGRILALDVAWEVWESPEATFFYLSGLPASLADRVNEVRYGRAGGSSEVRKYLRQEPVVHKLEKGGNDILITDSSGQGLSIVVKFLDLVEENSLARRQTMKGLEDPKAVVRDFGEFRQKHSKDHVEPEYNILHLGDLSQLIEDAKKIGDDPHADVSAFLLGETGTGKELIARLIHQRRKELLARESKDGVVPFVPANCGVLGGDPNIQIGRLFGRRPRYLDARDVGEKGYFMRASGYEWEVSGGQWKLKKARNTQDGLLFLDEIGELRSEAQAFLLRALNGEGGHEIEPLGHDAITVHNKLVYATDKDLSEDPNFDSALWNRINQGSLEMPPLRQRRKIIPHLVHYFASYYLNREKANRSVRWTDETLVAMVAYRWPGNIRELRNVVKYTLLRRKSDLIELNNLHDPNEAIRNSYDSIPIFWTTEEQQVIDKLTILVPDLFPRAFNAPNRNQWETMIALSVTEFHSWMEQKLKVKNLATDSTRTGVNRYLSAWQGTKLPKALLVEVVRVLTDEKKFAMSNKENERRLGVNEYATVKEFFGLSYKTLTG